MDSEPTGDKSEDNKRNGQQELDEESTCEGHENDVQRANDSNLEIIDERSHSSHGNAAQEGNNATTAAHAGAVLDSQHQQQNLPSSNLTIASGSKTGRRKKLSPEERVLKERLRNRMKSRRRRERIKNQIDTDTEERFSLLRKNESLRHENKSLQNALAVVRRWRQACPQPTVSLQRQGCADTHLSRTATQNLLPVASSTNHSFQNLLATSTNQIINSLLEASRLQQQSGSVPSHPTSNISHVQPQRPQTPAQAEINTPLRNVPAISGVPLQQNRLSRALLPNVTSAVTNTGNPQGLNQSSLSQQSDSVQLGQLLNHVAALQHALPRNLPINSISSPSNQIAICPPSVGQRVTGGSSNATNAETHNLNQMIMRSSPFGGVLGTVSNTATTNSFQQSVPELLQNLTGQQQQQMQVTRDLLGTVGGSPAGGSGGNPINTTAINNLATNLLAFQTSNNDRDRRGFASANPEESQTARPPIARTSLLNATLPNALPRQQYGSNTPVVSLSTNSNPVIPNNISSSILNPSISTQINSESSGSALQGALRQSLMSQLPNTLGGRPAFVTDSSGSLAIPGSLVTLLQAQSGICQPSTTQRTTPNRNNNPEEDSLKKSNENK